MPVNDFFAASNSAGYVGKALIGVQPQQAGYPKGVSNTTPFATQALTKLWTLTAAGIDGTTGPIDIYDASGYFFGEPLAAGTGGPGQFTFSPSGSSVVGDVTMWSALITGFSPTTLNPVAAGWTRLTGTGSTGQDATHLTVIDNGLYRCYIDKNISTGTNRSLNIMFFNGTAWKVVWASHANITDFTITSVTRNNAKLVEIGLTWRSAAPVTMSGVMRFPQGVTAFSLRIDTVGDTGNDFRLFWDDAATIGPRQDKATFLTETGGAITAFDTYGSIADVTITPQAQNFMVVPVAQLGLDVLVAVSSNEPYIIDLAGGGSSGIRYDAVASGDVPLYVWFGFMPRTYAMGDGGGADIGNGDGQFREAEDNFTTVAGTWAKVVAGGIGASNNAWLRNTAAANGDAVSWSKNFPAIGVYYIGIMAQTDGSGSADIEIQVDGVEVGTDQAVSASGFNLQTNQLLFGPVTITAAGNHTVKAVVRNVVATVANFDIDFLTIYPYESTASTPMTSIMPKNFAHSLLRQITPSS